MKQYARIANQIVAELFSTDRDINTLFHPDIGWVDCTGHEVRIGQYYDGTNFLDSAPRSVDQLKAEKAVELDRMCADEILSGFSSLALGSAHQYPSKPTDQANLTASVVDALIDGQANGWTTPFWCADQAGDWEWRPHTADQIRQVGKDGKAAILAAQSKNATLQAQLKAATTPEEIHAIAWAPAPTV